MSHEPWVMGHRLQVPVAESDEVGRVDGVHMHVRGAGPMRVEIPGDK